MTEEEKEGEKNTTKLQLKTNDEVWKKVLNYKIAQELPNNNKAVEKLILQGLSPDENKIFIWAHDEPPEEVLEQIRKFRSLVPIVEKTHKAPLLILHDEKSDTFYSECHIFARDFVDLSDPNATIDPELQEEYKANRELEPENVYFQQMVEDAEEGRQFSDIVVEYNESYNEKKPLKILGGQHRNEAIKKALTAGMNQIHGIKVYFSLNKDKRAEIMRVSNTNINVSPDLRDRIEEHRLSPANMLRDFCEKTGILKKGEDFGDKRRSEDEFLPTVRLMRSFIVNYFKGLEYKGSIDEDAYVPYVTKTGREVDPEYKKIFDRFKSKGGFDDDGLIAAGKMFNKLHESQYNKSDKLETTASAKKSYKIKSFNIAIITSWAFAAGVLQRDKSRLNKLYSLPDTTGKEDPLNALAMAKARHKTMDNEFTYRGLGTRPDDKERGRLLQLFLNYSNSNKQKITLDMCNAAINAYHANKARKEADEEKKKAFG